MSLFGNGRQKITTGLSSSNRQQRRNRNHFLIWGFVLCIAVIFVIFSSNGMTETLQLQQHQQAIHNLYEKQKEQQTEQAAGRTNRQQQQQQQQQRREEISTTKKESPVQQKDPPPPSPPQDTSVNHPDSIPKRTTTDTGVDVSDPSLYDGVDLHGDSSTATVMGVATGYGIDVYERFVGTLRKSGFKGHIILGVAPDVDEGILKYFRYRNVTAKIMKWTDCTYKKPENHKNDIFKKTTCADPYPDIKIRWSRFPLARDWLEECKTCTGPVLIMDVRDSYFQRDPFGPGSPVVKGLQVYEEHKNQTVQHWLTKWPLKQCKNVDYGDNIMLCSGTTTGTRAAMIKYLTIMYEEMKVWINDPVCHFDINGDDQSIHNHLYYSGQLPFATAVVNRMGGIVNTVGVEGAILAKQHRQVMMDRYNIEQGAAMWKPFDGSNINEGGSRWIGEQFNMADDEGYFTEFDGSRSRVIHQWDRFGRPFVDLWMNKHGEIFKDPIPEGFE